MLPLELELVPGTFKYNCCQPGSFFLSVSKARATLAAVSVGRGFELTSLLRAWKKLHFERTVDFSLHHEKAFVSVIFGMIVVITL